MAITDDVARLTSILVHDHVSGSKAANMRAAAFRHGNGLGILAKATGCTPQQVEAFEQGTAVPTTQQALAWLSALYGAQPRHAGDMRPVGDLEGAPPAYVAPQRAVYDPAEWALKSDGKGRTFTPDTAGLQPTDVARFLHDVAVRSGVKPSMPGLLRDPVLSVLALLDRQAAAGGPIRVGHNLGRDQIVRVHEALDGHVSRLRGDDVLGPVAVRIRGEFEQSVRWRQRDGRRRPQEGPDDDD